MTWRFADYENVENACDGDPEPAPGGGYWVRPVWRLTRLWICGIRLPCALAPIFGVARYRSIGPVDGRA